MGREQSSLKWATSLSHWAFTFLGEADEKSQAQRVIWCFFCWSLAMKHLSTSFSYCITTISRRLKAREMESKLEFS